MFAARSEERIYLAPSRRPGEARRRWLSVALVVATYGLAGASLVWEGGWGETPKPAEDIPVEIVVEPPPPPAPAAEDQSAERASGAEAKAEAPNPEASPTPTPQPPVPTPPLKTSEGEVAAPAPPAPAAEAPSPMKPAPAAGKSAPLFASVPDVDFGGAAMKAPVSGGNARANYFSILYGMILPRFHRPHGGRSALSRNYGALVFTVDGQGRLVNRYIIEESGLPELDRAAIDAVGAASPFPPPPPGMAYGSFRWTFGVD